MDFFSLPRNAYLRGQTSFKIKHMNVLLIDIYHEFQFKVLKKLKDRTPINYTYATTSFPFNYHGDKNNIEALYKEIFKDCKVDETNNFFYPSNIIKLLKVDWVLTNEDLLKHKRLEVLFYKLSDRGANSHLPVHERRQYYLILLNYFTYIFKTKKIDKLLCFDTPHSYFSILIYELGRYYKIPVVRMEHHFLSSFNLLIPDYYFPQNLPENYLQNYSLEQIQADLPDLLKEEIEKESDYLNEYTARESKRVIGKSTFSGFRLLQRFVTKVITNTIQGTFPFLFKKEVLHFSSLNNIHRPFWYRMSLNRTLVRHLYANHYYNKLSQTPDLSQKYVVFAMHMQPEKTSTPLAEEYDHQLLPITMISKSLPQGWKLYVKEHPNQFNERTIANANSRSTLFYDALLELPNVQLVPLNFPSKELIKHAQVVATLTGTIGWEALMTGKPVIAFGNAYYALCRAVGEPHSVEECSRLIPELIKLTKAEVKLEFYRHIHYMYHEKYLIQASRWEDEFAQSQVDPETQLNNICDALAGHLGKAI